MSSSAPEIDVIEKTIKTYAFLYEREWETGETTQHTLEIEAFGSEYARTLFLFKLDNPQDLISERVIEVTVTPARTIQ